MKKIRILDGMYFPEISVKKVNFGNDNDFWKNIYSLTSGRLDRHPGLGAAPTLARVQRQISTRRLGSIMLSRYTGEE